MYTAAMMFFFGNQGPRLGNGSPFGGSLLLLSILSILFGLSILANPELLAYLVASFFLLVGIWMLGVWFRIRRR